MFGLFSWLTSKWNAFINREYFFFQTPHASDEPPTSPITKPFLRVTPSDPTKTELKTLPDSLVHLDIYSHYMSLFRRLQQINSDPFNQYKSDAPLMCIRLRVSDDGHLMLNDQTETKVSYTTKEAKRIAIAIYQMAYAYTLNPENRDRLLLSKGIAPLLMLPFVHLHGTEEVLKISAAFRQLIFSFNKKLNSYSMNSVESEHTLSAQIIQRAFRAHRFHKKELVAEPFSETLIQSMHDHLILLNSNIPTPLPLLTTAQKRAWAESAKPGLQDFALKVATQLVTYRSHTKFMARLLGVVHQFNIYLQSLPIDNQDYVIIVPRTPPIKSNHWVTGLALPHLIKKPHAILFQNEVQAFHEKNPTIKHCVLLDDAIYSGRQMRDYLSLIPKTGLTPILIFPFYSRRIHDFHQMGIKCFLGELMLQPHQLWTYDDLRTLDLHIKHDWSPPSNKIGTFFNHRMADQASTFLDGLSDLNQNHRRLIPFHIPKPY